MLLLPRYKRFQILDGLVGHASTSNINIYISGLQGIFHRHYAIEGIVHTITFDIPAEEHGLEQEICQGRKECFI